MSSKADKPIGVLDWAEAFDVCRERDKPIRVMNAYGTVELIFPSGASLVIPGNKCDLFILPPDPPATA